MNPFWVRPEHQPSSGTIVEFEVRPVDLRLLDSMLMAMTPKGPATDSVHELFVRNVIAWRGIEAECTPENRRKIIAADDAVFGFTLFDWITWTRRIANVAFTEATLSETERKNLPSPRT